MENQIKESLNTNILNDPNFLSLDDQLNDLHNRIIKSVKKNVTISQEIENLKEKYSKETKINLIFLGKKSSGKTSSINNLLCYLNKLEFSLNPTSNNNNSYYFTEIESSNDGNFHLEFFEDEKKNEEKSFILNPPLVIEQINKILKEMFEKNNFYLENFQNFVTTIKLKIPGFPEYLRIVETPCYENQIITEKLKNSIAKKYFINIFILIKNICDKESNNQDLKKFFIYLKKNSKETFFIIIFSFLDKIFTQIKKFKSIYDFNSDIYKEAEKEFFTCQNSIHKYLYSDLDAENFQSPLLISEIFFQNNLTTKIISDSYNQGKVLINLIEDILEKEKKFIKINCYFNLVKTEVNNYIDKFKIEGKKNGINVDQEKLKTIIDTQQHVILEEISRNFDLFLSENFVNFKSTNSLTLSKVYEKAKYDKELNNVKFYNSAFYIKNNYLKLIYSNLSDEFKNFLMISFYEILPKAHKVIYLRFPNKKDQFNQKVEKMNFLNPIKYHYRNKKKFLRKIFTFLFFIFSNILFLYLNILTQNSKYLEIAEDKVGKELLSEKNNESFNLFKSKFFDYYEMILFNLHHLGLLSKFIIWISYNVYFYGKMLRNYFGLWKRISCLNKIMNKIYISTGLNKDNIISDIIFISNGVIGDFEGEVKREIKGLGDLNNIYSEIQNLSIVNHQVDFVNLKVKIKEGILRIPKINAADKKNLAELFKFE